MIFQISCIGNATLVAMIKTRVNAQKIQEHYNAICEPFENAFKEMREKAEKSKNNYAAYSHGVLLKDENMCNILTSQDFGNQLGYEVENYNDQLKAQKDGLFYNLMYYIGVDTDEHKEIKEKYERVEQEVLKFIRLLVANYNQLRSDILDNITEDE